MVFVQSAGKLILLVQNLSYIKSSLSIVFGPGFLINSGNILSCPCCFLLLMFFIASYNSSIENSSVKSSSRWPSPLFTPFCFLCIFSFFFQFGHNLGCARYKMLNLLAISILSVTSLSFTFKVWLCFVLCLLFRLLNTGICCKK